jgi:16S rRNA (guanine966-N2)-methyltransferase
MLCGGTSVPIIARANPGCKGVLLRIIGGSRRGRKLVAWDEAGIRPMRDFVRTALFNIIADFVPDARFLDLFSGTGSVGLEALSRGASSCVFVDRAPGACGVVRRNLQALDLLDQGSVMEGDVLVMLGELSRRGRRFDLVFIGPPYGQGLAERTLEGLSDGGLLTADCVVVAEVHETETICPVHGVLERVDDRRYGDNRVLFYRRHTGSAGDAYLEGE